MTLSSPQAKYFAHWLTRSLPCESLGKLTASRLDVKVRLQRLIKDLEKRLNLYNVQDEVDERKETLLSQVEAMLSQKIEQIKLITFRWKII